MPRRTYSQTGAFPPAVLPLGERSCAYAVGMIVRVRLFALLRERAGSAELELELPAGACVGDALAAPAVAALAQGLPLVMAVNREYARADHPLAPGDELALVPPVSGGAARGLGG